MICLLFLFISLNVFKCDAILSNDGDKDSQKISSTEIEKRSDYPYYAGDFGGGYHDHHHHVSSYDDPLKGLLIPLAGVALLGAAALFVSNPVLLQLGVLTGKRRRRDVEFNDKLKDIQALENFMDQLPRSQVLKQEKKLLASYLQCTGATNYENRCLERLACEIQKPSANVTDLERHVLDIVTTNLKNNEYVPTELKLRIDKAKVLGENYGKCEKYFCGEVDK